MTNSTPVALIPRNILFGNPVKANPQISPDGTIMAYLAPVNDVLNVWVGKIGSDEYQPVTKDEDRGVRFYFWAADNTHIVDKCVKFLSSTICHGVTNLLPSFQ
jgi:hypothetical protein